MIHLNVPNLLQLYEKIHFRVKKKMQQTVKTMQFLTNAINMKFLHFFS